MTIEEYFGDWNDVVNLNLVKNITKKLLPYKSQICPNLKDVFKAFRLCSYENLCLVVLGQDPYFTLKPDGQPVATGIAFANSKDTPSERLSPCLKVLRDSVINISPSDNHIIFDQSLESWEEQGVLLINTALTCLKWRPDSHALLWRPFITDFLTTLTMCREHIVYLLLGSDAQSYEDCLNREHNYIVKYWHPSYYARTNKQMPNAVWKEIQDAVFRYSGRRIDWYKVQQ